MKCLYCDADLKRHGNARYCPEKNGVKDYCYNEAKKSRQKNKLSNKLDQLKFENQMIGYLLGQLSNKDQKELEVTEFPMHLLEVSKLFQTFCINGTMVYKLGVLQLTKVESEGTQKIKITKLKSVNDFEL